MIDKGVCNERSIWNLSNCECKCDKSCDTGGYLDYEKCKCRKELVDKLVAECTENIDEVKIARMALFEHENKCVCSYTICCLDCNNFNNQHWNRCLFVYSHRYLEKDTTRDKELGVKKSFNYEGTIYWNK